jgi:hypothetical protein
MALLILVIGLASIVGHWEVLYSVGYKIVNVLAFIHVLKGRRKYHLSMGLTAFFIAEKLPELALP